MSSASAQRPPSAVLVASGDVLDAVRAALAPRFGSQLVCDVSHALARAGSDQVDLVVISLAEVGGLELLLGMAAAPSLRRTAVVAVAEDVAGALAAGAAEVVCPKAVPAELAARVGAALDMTATRVELARLQNELAPLASMLLFSEARHRAVLEAAQEAVILIDLDGAVDGLNQSAERLFGWTEADVVGHDFVEEFIGPASRPALAEQLAQIDAGMGSQSRELIGRRRDASPFPAEVRLARIETQGAGQYCAFIRDLTEGKRLEVELRQAQKLESVGRLAAGIAHEINTPIQFIGDNTVFLKEAFAGMARVLDASRTALREWAKEASAEVDALAEQLDLPYLLEQAPTTLDRTSEGLSRVATIVRAMKEFAHPDQKEKVAVDLNRALEATVEVARSEYRLVADVATDLGPLPQVVCNAGELNQVFLNLVINAAHAIADVTAVSGGRGTIHLASRLVGDAIEVAISDTGSGIPEAIQHRIFDPFFTTKEVGKGTGQGLAVARSVVKRHGGDLTFRTEVGRGTTFLVRLPVEPLQD